MKILITGASGQLGYDLLRVIDKSKHHVIATDVIEKLSFKFVDEIPFDLKDFQYYQMDITNKNRVLEVFEETKPEIVIHCAAWTAVDDAEIKKDLVYKINVEGTRNLVEASKLNGNKFLYLSTDYVFSGKGIEPWQPDENKFEPVNYYGETKLLGEHIVREQLTKFFIVRISWVFGINGNNFIKTMIKVGKNHDVVRVVNDQIGLPTYTLDLSKLLISMIETDHYGHYHVSNEGDFISWFEYTKKIFELTGIETTTIPVTTEKYGKSVAVRPKNSRLDKTKLTLNGFIPLPHWENALKRYLEEIGE